MIRKDMGKLDFTVSAEILERRVRGLYPWPGSYTFLDGKSLKVYKSSYIAESELDDSQNRAHVGTIVIVNADGDGTIAVRCADGALALHEVQLEGKKRMTVSAFLNGHPLVVGTRLG